MTATSKVSFPDKEFGLPIALKPLAPLSDADFFRLCQVNEAVQMERNARGEVELMPPVAGGFSNRNFRLALAFGKWVEQDGAGEGFDSSGGFVLPNGAIRSPDVAWVTKERLQALRKEDKDRFLPLAPDFVIELRSPSDRLKVLQEKMEEYCANGVRLGFLIDTANRMVMVYRPGQEAVTLLNPETVSGEPELSGLVLEMQPLFEDAF